MKIERKCNIRSKDWLNHDTVYMVLEVGDMVRTAHMRPGQFVHIKCGDALLLRRPISICSWTEEPAGDTLTIVFQIRGEGTRWLADCPTGHSVDVMGPLGNGFDAEDGPYLLVGGGIGVPPLLGCAGYSGGTATAILGFRSKEQAILLNQFASDCIDCQIATDDGSLGYHGFVDALVRRELERGERNYQAVLACGPKPMLRKVAKAAEEFGLPCQVSMEERMGCGIGACLVCACDMKDGTRKHVCKDGPVFDAKEVDWNV